MKGRRQLVPLLLSLCIFLAAPPAAFAAKSSPQLADILPRAQAGDAAAEVAVGKMYESGRGVARDYAEAAKWYQKAADQGDLAGEAALGALYLSGHGVARDYSEAAKLFADPAEKGLAQAQYYLGWLYARGLGVRFQDFNEAAQWLTRAANQNNAEAQMDLGDLYFNGQGVGQSYEDACFWYLLAGNHKLGKGPQKKLQKSLARARAGLSAEQLQSATARAAAWKPVTESQAKTAQ